MKALNLILILLFSVSVFANTTSGSWVNCTVKFEDGHEEKGLIKNFMSVREAIEYRTYTPNHGMTYGTTRQKVFDKKFKFKNSENGKSRTIKRDDIVWVELFDEDEVFHFDKMNFKSLSKKGKPVGKQGTTFMLLHKKMDKVNVYIKTFLNQDKLLDSPIYFKSVKDDFAVPYFEIKMNVFTLMSKKKMKRELYNSIKWVTRDCQEFNDYISTYQNYRDEKLSKKEIKEMIKKYEGKTLTDKAKISADVFASLFEEYHEMCPN